MENAEIAETKPGWLVFSAFSASLFRVFSVLSCLLVFALLANNHSIAQQSPPNFAWPGNARAAISLSFDDARTSQVDVGTALLDRYGVKATFFVVPSSVEQRLEGWKAAVAAGHEIGNHSLTHPCSGNFPWSRQKALEDYSLEKMHRELVEANERIRHLLGVAPETFAYPCGQTFVGRGLDTRSYVPLVAGMFRAGRGWLGEAPNDPVYCDMAQLTGMEMDGKDIDHILPLIEQARESVHWVVLAGHEIGSDGRQTTRTGMLEQLLKYARDPVNRVWIAPVGTVARYIRENRKEER
ncbi:MAG: polysaccharide deacetylase family protein [Blastocatellales bacterium]|nr:polysaccharide deacetylase family protein [Blastocatellales bacterium]